MVFLWSISKTKAASMEHPVLLILSIATGIAALTVMIVFFRKKCTP